MNVLELVQVKRQLDSVFFQGSWLPARDFGRPQQADLANRFWANASTATLLCSSKRTAFYIRSRNATWQTVSPLLPLSFPAPCPKAGLLPPPPAELAARGYNVEAVAETSAKSSVKAASMKTTCKTHKYRYMFERTCSAASGDIAICATFPSSYFQENPGNILKACNTYGAEEGLASRPAYCYRTSY